MKDSNQKQCCRTTHRSLAVLPSGSRGVVQRIETSEPALQRLMAMGLCEGREIHVVRQGNPLIIGLLGARIGLSSRLAKDVLVDACCCGRKS